MKDNPEMSKVYLTGVFYFILMYTGSNVLPIARFLKLTHMKQAFKADEVRYKFFFELMDQFCCHCCCFVVCYYRYYAEKYIRTAVT